MGERNKWDIMLTMFTNTNKEEEANLKREFLHETVTISQLYSVNVIRQLFVRWLESLQGPDRRRDEQQSKLLREIGNELYKSKPPNLRKAVEFYTKAIYLAPNDPSLQLSLAHANRAVALMALSLFQEAFDDCAMAIKYSYPKENILKVLFRQAGCSLELNNRAMLAKVIQMIEMELKNHKSRGFYMKILTEYKSKMLNLKKSPKTKSKDDQECYQRKNIKIEKSEDVGRFVRTGDAIAKDELIMTDRAFAFVPVYEEYPDDDAVDTDCQNCAKTNVIQFPCETCHRATYCSLLCRTEHTPVHRYECPGYQLNLWYYIGIAHLSMRTFLTGFPELIQKLSAERGLSLADLWARMMKLAKDASPTAFKYGQVLGLVTNFDKMADSKDFIRYSLTATMLVVYLKEKTDFFEKLPADCEKIMKTRSDWELFAGSLIMLHMGQLVNNGHAITGLRTTLTSEFDCTEPPDSIKVGRLHCYVRNVRAFTGLFPRISLLNHSCDANIWNSFKGNRLAIHASRNIDAGEQVFNSYGPHYRLMDTAERRQALLEQYSFHCKCTKCEQVPEDLSCMQNFECQHCSEACYTKEARNYWWRSLDARPKINCPKCGKRICFQPYKAFLEQLGKLEAGKLDVPDAFSTMVTMFFAPTWGHNNEMRVDMGVMILSHFMPFMPEYFRMYIGLIAIARQIMDHREQKTGIHSIEYVMAATYYFDLVAMRKALNLVKCKVEADLSQIKRSLEILAPEARQIFERYIEQYIGDDNDGEIDDTIPPELSKLRSSKNAKNQAIDFGNLFSPQ